MRLWHKVIRSDNGIFHDAKRLQKVFDEFVEQGYTVHASNPMFIVPMNADTHWKIWQSCGKSVLSRLLHPTAQALKSLRRKWELPIFSIWDSPMNPFREFGLELCRNLEDEHMMNCLKC